MRLPMWAVCKSPQRSSRHARIAQTKGFSIIELLVVLGIIAVLIGILIPTIISIREQSRSTMCLSNLRQIGHVIMLYIDDNRGRLPPADLRDPPFKHPPGNWATVLVSGKYVTVPDATSPDSHNSIFHCPNGIDENGFENFAFNSAYNSPRESALQSAYWERQSGTVAADGSWVPGLTIRVWYGINADYQAGDEYPMFRVPSETNRTQPHMLAEIKRGAELVMVYDGFFHHDGHANLMGNARHLKRTATNYLFADQHAVTIRTADLPKSFSDADLSARPYPKFKLKQQ